MTKKDYQNNKKRIIIMTIEKLRMTVKKFRMKRSGFRRKRRN